MTTKTIKIAVIAAAVAVAGYWYWSPFLAIRQMQSAAQEKDAEAFNERVDYPKLRESLKGQLSAVMGEQMAKTQDAGNPFAALGSMLGLAMVDRFVDAMVRPETVMRAMQDGQMSPAAAKTSDAPAPTTSNPDSPAPAAAREDNKPKWTYDRKGVDRLIAYATDPQKPGAPNSEKLGVVFERSGFANWKLTEVRLPVLGR
ncbi:conserved hypothetical protein (plasmid) [Polaromonas naphthalenivorans CJ2]|uniref:DUF2939 domain-containing protein n=2 Tax=Polaromonas naphthalenivorans TaxID=216465 RepID=A1VWF8_POLNA|nr:conserved hypothetical protein [Polaromonas naphthalenivorans CJ2]